VRVRHHHAERDVYDVRAATPPSAFGGEGLPERSLAAHGALCSNGHASDQVIGKWIRGATLSECVTAIAVAVTRGQIVAPPSLPQPGQPPIDMPKMREL